ncbi:MAG: ATP-dependent RecD-like DNA helicase, partial [Clostridia bacterium]|nr:ATP-dependent RecD-like DNA helicase [Clostridia bacterium]
MEIISGIIEKITFRNEANAYTVALLKTKDEQIVVVGTLPFINEGDSVELVGEYTVHATYGEQFKVQSFTQKTPENSAAILRYLSSGAIKGVGPTTATRLVEKFGADTLDIIQNHPEDMANLKGISLNKAMQ